METKLEIVTATSGEMFEQARLLFREYAEWLGVDLCFQNFEGELTNLETVYHPPDGSLLLAFYGEQIAGCVAVRKLEADVCEMKRLFVKPDFQNLKIGKKLIYAVIKRARDLEYKRMRLDTLPLMEKAQNLYRSVGFKEIEAYRYNPDPKTTFMELNLNGEAAHDASLRD